MPDPRPNTLYYGDNLQILRERIPSESVDLCYIDPPFNSQQDYNQIYSTVKRKDAAQTQAFTDTWTWDTQAAIGFQEIITNEGGRFQSETIELFRGLRAVLKESPMLAYLASMTLRLVEIRRVLKPTASFYLHCDPTASHYLKITVDSIFGARNYRNEIIWKRTSAHSSAKRFGPVHDVILFYGASDSTRWVGGHQAYDEEYVKQRFARGNERPWKDADLTGSGIRHGETGNEWRGFDVTARGRHWAYPPLELDRLDAAGMIYWPSKSGGWPRYKKYLDDTKGVPLQDVWTDIYPINSQAAERLGYPTQKPEAILERIIKASSNEGDIVLDAYCGCGTTVAVAQRLNRNWIGIDITFQSVSLILKRLEDSFGADVLKQIRVDGIPRDLGAAEALATRKDDRTRKEFEKWAVLTYSNNRAVINQKKGADQGIDGTAYFMTGPNETAKMVFQVKSGGVQRGDIAKLNSDMQREGAELGTLITLNEPTQPMRDEASKTGMYHHVLMGRSMSRIQIVTVREIIEGGKRLDLPMTADVLKSARRQSTDEQMGLGI